MSFELPPIVKCAERLMLEIELVVRAFPRYHKYALGADLRKQAREVVRLTSKAADAQLAIMLRWAFEFVTREVQVMEDSNRNPDGTVDIDDEYWSREYQDAKMWLNQVRALKP